MPKAMELALKKKAKKMGLSKKRTGAYVFGTMRKTGWTPATQKKDKRLNPEHPAYRLKK